MVFSKSLYWRLWIFINGGKPGVVATEKDYEYSSSTKSIRTRKTYKEAKTGRLSSKGSFSIISISSAIPFLLLSFRVNKPRAPLIHCTYRWLGWPRFVRLSTSSVFFVSSFPLPNLSIIIYILDRTDKTSESVFRLTAVKLTQDNTFILLLF